MPCFEGAELCLSRRRGTETDRLRFVPLIHEIPIPGFLRKTWGEVIISDQKQEGKFIIKGKGVIAGVDNGNPISHEFFKTSERKAFHGLCLAVVQSKRERGAIRLSAESEGLQAGDLLIQVK